MANLASRFLQRNATAGHGLVDQLAQARGRSLEPLTHGVPSSDKPVPKTRPTTIENGRVDWEKKPPKNGTFARPLASALHSLTRQRSGKIEKPPGGGGGGLGATFPDAPPPLEGGLQGQAATGAPFCVLPLSRAYGVMDVQPF